MKKIYTIIFLILSSFILFPEFSYEYENIRYSYNSLLNTFVVSAIDKNNDAIIDRDKFLEYRTEIKYEKNNITVKGLSLENEDFKNYLEDAKIIIESPVLLPDDSSYIFSQTNQEVDIYNDIMTENVTNMSYMFYYATKANPNVTLWDTKNVEDISYMFYNATEAKPNIYNWDFHKVRDFNRFIFNNNGYVPILSNEFYNINQNDNSYSMFIESTNDNKDLVINLKNIEYKYNNVGNDENILYKISNQPVNVIFPDNVEFQGAIKKDSDPPIQVMPGSKITYSGEIANKMYLYRIIGSSDSNYSPMLYQIFDTTDNEIKQISPFVRNEDIKFSHDNNRIYKYKPFIYSIKPKTIYVGDTVTADELMDQISDSESLQKFGTFTSESTQGTIIDSIATKTGSENYTIHFEVLNNDSYDTYTIDFTIPIIIRPTNEKYDPVGSILDVDLYSKLSVIAPMEAIKNNLDIVVSKYEFLDPKPDTLTSGIKDAVVRLTYYDGTYDDVKVKINVRGYNSFYRPVLIDHAYVNVNHVLTDEDAKSFVLNKNELPSNAKYTFDSTHSTHIPGTRMLIVKVIYEDNTYSEILGTITIKSYKDSYTLTGGKIKVSKNYVLTEKDAKDLVIESKDIPNTNYRFKNSVDTSISGIQNVVIVASFPDGTEKEVNAQIEVSSIDVEKYRYIVETLNSVDTSIINHKEEGIYFETNLTYNLHNKIYKIAKRGALDNKELFSSIKLGYNHKLSNTLNLGGFIEYDYKLANNIGLGFKYNVNLNNQNILGFLRYRLDIDKYINQHSLDLYTRYTIEYINKVSLRGLFSLLLTYESATKLDDTVSLNNRFITRFDSGLRIGYDITDNTKIYLEPHINLQYTTKSLLIDNNDSMSISNKYNIFNASLKILLEHKLNKLKLGESLLFDSYGRLNAKFYLKYTF